MKLIVGLGNPGEKYEKTRHNVGFRVVEKLAADFKLDKKFEVEICVCNTREFLNGSRIESGMTTKRDPRCRISSSLRTTKTPLEDEKVIVLKPMTFMNLSGKAIKSVMNYYKVELSDLIVVHDDLDIPFGDIRVRKGGRSGGHNGINSIIQELGESEFLRVRIGIGRPEQAGYAAEDYVLDKFPKEQEAELEKIIDGATGLIDEWLRSDNLDNTSVSVL